MTSHAAARVAQPAMAAEPRHSLTMTRLFAASSEQIFRAWTDPAQLGRWMGPRTIRRCEVLALDARPGGTYRIVMENEGGGVHTVGGTYREVVPNQRLVFTWAWEGCEGDFQQKGAETVITVSLRAVGRQTEMTLHQEGFVTETARDSHDHGWTGSFEKLGEVVETARG